MKSDAQRKYHLWVDAQKEKDFRSLIKGTEIELRVKGGDESLRVMKCVIICLVLCACIRIYTHIYTYTYDLSAMIQRGASPRWEVRETLTLSRRLFFFLNFLTTTPAAKITPHINNFLNL